MEDVKLKKGDTVRLSARGVSAGLNRNTGRGARLGTITSLLVGDPEERGCVRVRWEGRRERDSETIAAHFLEVVTSDAALLARHTGEKP